MPRDIFVWSEEGRKYRKFCLIDPLMLGLEMTTFICSNVKYLSGIKWEGIVTPDIEETYTKDSGSNKYQEEKMVVCLIIENKTEMLQFSNHLKLMRQGPHRWQWLQFIWETIIREEKVCLGWIRRQYFGHCLE